MSMAQRKFFGEISSLLDRSVMVIMVDGKVYTGNLVGVIPETLSVCLGEAKNEKGKLVHRIFLNGDVVSQILAVEKSFDLKALAERLEKVFPNLVKLYEEQGFIWVMDRIKVTEKGVEGVGPSAERVQKVYDQFSKETQI